jgi:prolipoprotein diacylglyceryl transferase
VRASFPSPSEGVIHLGPFPLRAYAFFILIGIGVSIVTAERRLQARGYAKGAVWDIAVWAVPFGIIGGRVYHVITDNELYFRKGRDWVDAFEIWHGGLGIWGAISLGALGAYIGVKRRHPEIPFSALADALAPGIPLAQGIGRLGNYFNQELYGRPSTLPWAVEIDPVHRETRYATVSTYQPTFLYELIWDVGTAGVVIWAERRFKLGAGRAFALYVAVYCVGRFWIEALRIDDAHRYLGLRLNDYTAIIVFLLAAGYIWIVGRRQKKAQAASAEPVDGPADGPLDGPEDRPDAPDPEADPAEAPAP